MASILKNAVFTTLVVEGDLAYSSFLEKFLSSEGHLVLRARSATEALDATLKFQPDLILLNSELDGVNGLKILEAILAENPGVAVILMATAPNIAEAIQAIKLGAAEYLERPLDQKKIKQAIDSQKAIFLTL